jgi:amidophosphoribosyltransferase
MDTISISDFREFSGKKLAINDYSNFFFNSSETVVVGCPNSGIISGKSYANKSNLIYKQIIKKNRNTNRTFIMSNQEERIEHLKKKYYFEKKEIENKVIIIVDDSIVRGNTLNILLQQLKLNNPKEIHMRIASPPVISNCFYGIDIPTKEELIFNKHNSEEKLVKYYNVTSFKYLPLEQIIKNYNNEFCISCFNGIYNKDILGW